MADAAERSTPSDGTPTGSRYVDVSELRRRWPLSRNTIYELVSSPQWLAQVRTLRFGRRLMFLEADVIAYESRWLVTLPSELPDPAPDPAPTDSPDPVPTPPPRKRAKPIRRRVA